MNTFFRILESDEKNLKAIEMISLYSLVVDVDYSQVVFHFVFETTNNSFHIYKCVFFCIKKNFMKKQLFISIYFPNKATFKCMP